MKKRGDCPWGLCLAPVRNRTKTVEITLRKERRDTQVIAKQAFAYV